MSRFEPKHGDTRTATKWVHVPAQGHTVIRKPMRKRIVAYHQERTPWFANVHTEMAGIMDTSKLMAQSTVKISSVEGQSQLPWLSINWFRCQFNLCSLWIFYLLLERSENHYDYVFEHFLPIEFSIYFLTICFALCLLFVIKVISSKQKIFRWFSWKRI